MAKDPFRSNMGDPLQKKLVDLEKEIGKKNEQGEAKRAKLRADPGNNELRAEVRRDNAAMAELQRQSALVAEAISIAAGGKQITLPLPDELNK